MCDRTELLTVYDSDKQDSDDNKSSKNTNHHGFWRNHVNNNSNSNNSGGKKRGGFRDLLHLYASRHLSILEDEKDSDVDLVQWLEGAYGRQETNKLRRLTRNNRNSSSNNKSNSKERTTLYGQQLEVSVLEAI